MPETKTDQDFQYFLDQDFEDYEGDWIAIYEREVIYSDQEERVVRKIANEKVDGEPLITKIPSSNQTLIL